MIDFTNVKSIVIPEGEVASISRNGEILWQRQTKKYKRELLYLESTGTQWIDTGIYPSAITYLEAEAQYTAINKRQTLLGCYKGSTYNTFGGVNVTSVYANFWVQWGSDGKYGGSAPADLKKHIFAFDKTNRTFSVDGSSWSDKGDGVHANDTLYMFATHSGSTIDRQASVKIYRFKMMNESVLVRDFIPVLDMNDAPCMYDKVSGELFYNKGTGVFKYAEMSGLPSEYQEVAYIESTGTQYIDTGLRLNQNSKLELEMSHFDASIQRMVFGSRSSATQNNFSVVSGPVGGIMSIVTDFDDYRNNRLAYAISGGEFFKISISKEKLKINDLEQAVSTYQAFTTPGTAYLFNGNGTYPAGYLPAVMRLYYCKIYNNDVLVRNFIPCYRKSDGKSGMYDLVTNEFFTNIGTSEFMYGEV